MKWPVSKVGYCHLGGYGWICVTKDYESLRQQVVGTIFLYLNLKQKPLFTNNGGHIWFSFRKYFLVENCILKKDNSEPFCFLIKSVLLKREHK